MGHYQKVCLHNVFLVTNEELGRDSRVGDDLDTLASIVSRAEPERNNYKQWIAGFKEAQVQTGKAMHLRTSLGCTAKFQVKDYLVKGEDVDRIQALVQKSHGPKVEQGVHYLA